MNSLPGVCRLLLSRLDPPSLFAAYLLLPTVCCLLFAVCCLLFAVCCLLAKPRLRTQERPQGSLNPPEYPVPADTGGRAFRQREARLGRRKLVCVSAAPHGIKRHRNCR